jgi:diacylglycerol kinase
MWIKSAQHAFSGFRYAFRHERNFQIECFIALIMIVLLFLLPLASWERVFLLVMIGWVLSAELANTIGERIVDMLKPRLHPYARVIKDIMASVVLLASIIAFTVGILILYPHAIEVFS